MSLRLIPRLDIKNETLVKGIQLEGLRVLGAPDDFARYYYQMGADELLYVDAVASLYGRNSLLDMISRTARSVFIPLTVGGGIRSLRDISAVLASGGDKVAINTAAHERPELLDEAVEEFGSSTIVLSLEARVQDEGNYHAYINSGRDDTGRDAIAWAREAVDRGVGEILVTSVDRDGTRRGFDITLIQKVAESVSVPIIACGGGGTLEHVVSAAKANANAISCASMLHYHAIERLDDATISTVKATETLLQRSINLSKDNESAGIGEVKQALSAAGFDVRPTGVGIR